MVHSVKERLARIKARLTTHIPNPPPRKVKAKGRKKVSSAACSTAMAVALHLQTGGVAAGGHWASSHALAHGV